MALTTKYIIRKRLVDTTQILQFPHQIKLDGPCDAGALDEISCD